MKSPAKRKPGFRSLALEQLESRVVLTGNVQAFVTGGTLRVNGDSADNQILISQVGPQIFQISSRDGTTTINGQTAPQTFSRAKNDMQINMGAGNDVVEIAGVAGAPLTVKQRLSVVTGPGDDQVLVSNVRALRLTIDTGAGNDTLNIGSGGATAGVNVTKEAVIAMGAGNDNAVIANSQFRKTLVLDMGAGTDNATMTSTSVTKKSTLNGGAGIDTLNRQGVSGKLSIVSFENNNTTVSTPTAANDTASVAPGHNTVINVATNDTPLAQLDLNSIVITQQPTNGTVTVNNNGTVTYTNTNASGTTDSFKYRIRNQQGLASNEATVSLTISGTALAAIDDAASITEDATPNTVTGNVLTNDTGGGANKTVAAVNGNTGGVGNDVATSFGTIHINSDGSFTYTLNNTNATVNALNDNQTLTDVIAYLLSDGTSQSSARLTVTIQGHTG
jgi:VCBS repeat-containing protein